MCQLLGLFFDLAETSTNTMGTQLEELQKYKTAYQNKLKRERNSAKKQDLQLVVAELQRKNIELRKEIVVLKNKHGASEFVDSLSPSCLEKHRKSAQYFYKPRKSQATSNSFTDSKLSAGTKSKGKDIGVTSSVSQSIITPKG
jgi:hypothetical protein